MKLIDNSNILKRMVFVNLTTKFVCDITNTFSFESNKHNKYIYYVDGKEILIDKYEIFINGELLDLNKYNLTFYNNEKLNILRYIITLFIINKECITVNQFNNLIIELLNKYIDTYNNEYLEKFKLFKLNIKNALYRKYSNKSDEIKNIFSSNKIRFDNKDFLCFLDQSTLEEIKNIFSDKEYYDDKDYFQKISDIISNNKYKKIEDNLIEKIEFDEFK